MKWRLIQMAIEWFLNRNNQRQPGGVSAVDPAVRKRRKRLLIWGGVGVVSFGLILLVGVVWLLIQIAGGLLSASTQAIAAAAPQVQQSLQAVVPTPGAGGSPSDWTAGGAETQTESPNADEAQADESRSASSPPALSRQPVSQGALQLCTTSVRQVIGHTIGLELGQVLPAIDQTWRTCVSPVLTAWGAEKPEA
jgi:hypothetical protein